jgi:hypothetical protein
MASDYDATEFVDSDFNPQKTQYSSFAQGFGQTPRAPTREEVDSRVSEAQQKLAELKRAQEELERERAALEETRRRQVEFQTGRQEMTQHLTRGVGLLEEAEFNARRDAEQMTKILFEFREALKNIELIQEETWTRDNFHVELTRALTVLENARMEWNAARLKLPVLSREAAPANTTGEANEARRNDLPLDQGFFQLCRLGLALTWPLALVAIGALGLLVAILVRH